MRVRVVGLKEYTDRHGRLRRYYRRKGAPSVAISTDLKGSALVAEIARLDALYRPLAPAAGTLRLLITEFKQRSEHWRNLRPRTRTDYERIFTALAPVLDHGLTRFTTPVVVGIRDKARDAHGFKFANQTVVTLKKVFAFGVQYGHVKENPLDAVEPISRPADLPEANRPWLPTETLVILAGFPIHVKAPTALAAYLGVRLGDTVHMPSAARKDALLDFLTSKTGRRLELSVCDDLAGILDEFAAWRKTLKHDQADMMMFVNARGKPWTEDGFKTSFGKERDKLLKAKKIGPGITFHGARHGVATILADENFAPDQVKHLLGHGAETMTEHYSRRAKRRQLLKDMADRVQMVLRNTAKPNVVAIGSGTEVSNRSA